MLNTQFLQDVNSTERATNLQNDTEKEKQGVKRLNNLRELLSPYEEIQNLTSQGQHAEAVKKLLEVDIFEKQFLSVVISRPNYDYQRIEEKSVVSMDSLFSQIGGLLSIWIGLTFVCIVELMELGLNVIEVIVNHKRNPDNDHSPN